ncbi:MAG: amino acid ABC transporter substrate-binding protein [Rhodospirillales bacterium]|nr:amino acid ABC transporter substrate-binding protein [Rhodospirillales bacterium]
MTLAAATALAAVLAGHRVEAGPVLDAVKARGQIVCGISDGRPGFAQADAQGRWRGFAVDICRAVAATILRDANKAKFVALTAAKRFPALQAGEVDLLVSDSTYTLARDAGQGVEFTGIYYYDSQGFLVKKSGAKTIKDAKDLHRAMICYQTGTTSEANLTDYFAANRMRFVSFAFERSAEARDAFLAGRCDALTSDLSALYAILAAKPQHAVDYAILRQTIAKEPLGPAVRQGDPQFADIVRWTLYAMIEAEEYGVTARNVDEMLKSPHATIKEILGVTPGMGKALGVDDRWVYNIVKQVGNYGESYDRNLGGGSPLGIPRSLNAQWTKGGILYAPPIR